MAILFINRSDTQCGACKHSADYREKSHITRLGLGEDRTGCGAEFTEVSSYYLGMDEAVKAIRPDLPFVGPRGAIF